MKILVEKRNQLDAKAKELSALVAKDSLSADELGRMKELTAEVKALSTEVDQLAETEALSKSIQSATGVKTELDAHAKGEQAVVNKEGAEFSGGQSVTEKQWKAISEPSYTKAFDEFLRSKGNLGKVSAWAQKQLIEGIDSDGGYLAPPQMVAGVLSRKPAPTRLGGLVSRMSANGSSVNFTEDQYSGSDSDIYPNGVRVTNTGEVPSSATVHAATGPVFGERKISINTWMVSKRISNDLIEDSGTDIVGYIGDSFETAANLLIDRQILLGLGGGLGCMGIITNADGAGGVVSKQSITNDVLGADDIVGLEYELPEQYIENARFVMNRASTGRTVALLKDGSNRYLFRRGGFSAGLADPAPDTLDGYPLVWSAFMPNVGDGTFPVLFGDLRGYMLVTRSTMSVMVKEIGDDAAFNRTTVISRLRFGGDAIQPYTMRLLKIQ